ncbi:autotransporter outer membrane beta-barrel domain-containing protein, partial [Campylobacter jejuni]
PEARVNTTVSGSISNQINITDQGPHTIIIEAGGTLGNENNNNKIIYAHASGNNTLTLTNLTNNGTINGKVAVEHDNNFNGTITVNTFENKNQINGNVYMGVWGGNSGTLNIDKFDNSGTITASGQGVFFEGKNTNIQSFSNTGVINANKGVDIGNIGGIKVFNNSGTIQGTEVGVAINTKIDTFTNGGFINSQGNGMWSNGIWISDQTTIENFNNTGTIQTSTGYNGINMNGGTIKNFNNTGTIQTANRSGVYVSQGTIETFTNIGTIKSTGNIQPSDDIDVSSGVYLGGANGDSTIKTFTNTGLISGIMGVNIVKSSIENFTNQGTIESISDHKLGAAINLMALFGKPSTIKNFNNEGTIKSNSNGIQAESGNKIETLINKGTIEAGLNGISFYEATDGSSGDKMELGNIILEKGSSIKAGNNGINIDGTSKDIEADGIEVKQGASVIGGNAGIAIGGGKEINTQITIAGEV